MQVELFDERRIATETRTASYWVEIRHHIDTDSPSVSGHRLREATFAEAVTWVRQQLGSVNDEASVYLLPDHVAVDAGEQELHAIHLTDIDYGDGSTVAAC